MQRYTCFLLLLIAIKILGCKKVDPPSPLIGLSEVVKKRQLHLVEYRFNHSLFIHKKQNQRRKLELIVRCPVAISAKIDLEKMTIDSHSKKIILPLPSLDSPNIKLTDPTTEITQVNDGFLIAFGGSKANLFENLIERLKDTEEEIRESSLKLGIVDQSKKEAIDFISDLLASFGIKDYTIEFMSDEKVVDDKNIQKVDQIKSLPSTQVTHNLMNSIEVESNFLDELD